MRLTLAVPIKNQLDATKAILMLLRTNTSEDVEYMFIDNGSTDNIRDYLFKFIKPRHFRYIRNDDNLGMIATMQQAFLNCHTEILGIIHNDVYVYEKDWDKRVVRYFEQMPNLGGAGFFGAQGVLANGGRCQDVPAGRMAGWSNMLEAEVHGMRLEKEWHPVAIFDGLCMIFRMEMLRKNCGFDQNYRFHHLYDRDASLMSLATGYDNIVVNVPCHHISGVTANSSDYQNWINGKLNMHEHADMWCHDENTRIFMKKFESALPLYVENDFSFRSNAVFKGDAIRRLIQRQPSLPR